MLAVSVAAAVGAAEGIDVAARGNATAVVVAVVACDRRRSAGGLLVGGARMIAAGRAVGALRGRPWPYSQG